MKTRCKNSAARCGVVRHESIQGATIAKHESIQGVTIARQEQARQGMRATRHKSGKAMKPKIKTKPTLKIKSTNKTTIYKKKEKTIVRGVKRRHPFMQFFRVCRKELLQCDGSNLTLSFQAT
jgi:hypothetical protein